MPPDLPLSRLFRIHVVGQSVADAFLVEYRSFEQGGESGVVVVPGTFRAQLGQYVAKTLLEPKRRDNSVRTNTKDNELIGNISSDKSARDALHVAG